MDNRFNKVFHFLNRKSKHDIKSQSLKLDSITLHASSDLYLVVVITDISIKNQVATSRVHIHSHNRLVIKIVYYAVNVISIEVKLFAIRCGINQATCLPNIKYIFIITDFIYMAKKTFNSSFHLYQAQLAVISGYLRKYFQKDNNNSIKFWDCPSS